MTPLYLNVAESIFISLLRRFIKKAGIPNSAALRLDKHICCVPQICFISLLRRFIKRREFSYNERIYKGKGSKKKLRRNASAFSNLAIRGSLFEVS